MLKHFQVYLVMLLCQSVLEDKDNEESREKNRKDGLQLHLPSSCSCTTANAALREDRACSKAELASLRDCFSWSEQVKDATPLIFRAMTRTFGLEGLFTDRTVS